MKKRSKKEINKQIKKLEEGLKQEREKRYSCFTSNNVAMILDAITELKRQL